MSEHDDNQPMTRRERRMREMGGVQASEPQEHETATPEAPAAQPSAASEKEISPYHEDGSLRTRAEMRALRAALREQSQTAPDPEEAGRGQDEHAESEPHPAHRAPAVEEEPEEPAAEVPEEPETEEVSDAEAPAEPEASTEPDEPAESEAPAEPEEPAEVEEAPESESSEADSGSQEDIDGAVPPTQPFTLDDLADASHPHPEESEPEVIEPEAEPEPEVPEPEALTPKPKRFGWRRSKKEELAPVTEEPVAAEPAAEEPAVTEAILVADASTDEPAEGDESDSPEPEAAETVAIQVESVEETETEAPVDEDADVDIAPIFEEIPEAEADPEPDVVAQNSADDAAEAEAKPKKAGYSFPDIRPPEEWRSVFDDPESRMSDDKAGDFDSLIERAVAQEGGTSGTNTAALIMPTSLDETGGIAGPLGATGNLFVTGSLELPKSLSETGGHSDIHDSIKLEPVTPLGKDSEHSDHGTYDGPAPVAAKSAVSARRHGDVPVMAAPTKDKSKLPMVLGFTGGGLVVVVAGLGFWAWQSGMFG